MQGSKWFVGIFVLSALAQAAIPDRVNYQKFADLYSAQRALSDQARAESNGALSNYQDKQAIRQRYEQEKASLQEGIRQDLESIRQHKASIDSLNAHIQQNSTAVIQNNNRINALATEIQSLASQIVAKEGQIQSQRNEVQAASVSRAAAQTQVVETEQKHAEAQGKLQGAVQQRDQVNAALQKSLQDIQNLRNKVQEIDRRIQATKAEIGQLTQSMAKLSTDIQASNFRKAELERRRNELNVKPKKTPAEEAELRKIINTDLPQIVAQISALTQAQQFQAQRLALLSNNLPKDEDALHETKHRLTHAEQDEQRLRRELAQAEQAVKQEQDFVAQWWNIVVQRREQFRAADQEFQRQDAVLKALCRDQDNLKLAQRNDEAECNRLADENRRLQGIINNQQAQVRSLQEATGLFEAAIARRRGQISLVEVNITTAKVDEANAYALYQNRDALASQEEAKTATAWSTYQSVLAQYNQEKEDARRLGVNDGSAAGNKEGIERGTVDGKVAGEPQGAQDGANQGDRDGRNRDYQGGYQTGDTRGRAEGTVKGKSDGQQTGLTDGAKEGYAAGLAEGEANGKRDGYKKGYDEGYAAENNAANKQKGFDDGVAKGIVRAQEQARREDYPRGRSETESEILKSPPQQKIEIDQTPPAAPETTRWTPVKDVFAKLYRLLVSDALADHLSNISVPAVSPNYTYKQYLHTFEHPDFDTAYRGAYDSSYRDSFSTGYRSSYLAAYQVAYDAAYRTAYDAALAVSHPDETAKGDQRGYDAGYQAVYQPAYQAAYDTAYAQSYDDGHNKGLPVNYDKGFKAGQAEGLVAGKREGAAFAFADGQKAGEPDGYNKNIAGERQKAYAAGKADLQAEYQSSYKPKLLSAKIVDKDGTGKFAVWGKVTLQVVVRNYGGKGSADNALEISTKDLRGNYLSKFKKAGLKALPAGAEATYRGVLAGNPIGGFDGVKVEAALASDGNAVNAVTFEQKVDQDLQIVFTNSQGQYPMLIGYVSQWFLNKIWIKNISQADVPDGYKARIVSSGRPLQFAQKDWNNPARFSAIGSGQWGSFDIETASNQTGKFDDVPVVVEVQDGDGYLIYHGEVKASVSVGEGENGEE